MKIVSKHVVLVEDEVNIAEAIRFLLSNEGWRVETLANGTNAVEVIRNALPDLVMLDVMLPGKSGFEILPFYIRRRSYRQSSSSSTVPGTK